MLKEASMVSIGVEGPLSGWVGPLTGWLVESGVAPARAARAVSAFERLSVWMAGSGLGRTSADGGHTIA